MVVLSFIAFPGMSMLKMTLSLSCPGGESGAVSFRGGEVSHF